MENMRELIEPLRGTDEDESAALLLLSEQSRRSGFSLVEVLIAAAIMLVVALGLLPLFSQAMVNNSAGNDYTQVSNHAKSEVERLNQLAIDSADLTIAAGQPSRITEDFYSLKRKRWVNAATLGSERPVWSRTTTIRQCGVTDVSAGRCATSLPGGTDSSAIHVKDIEVQIVGGRPEGGILGTGKRITLATLKPF